MRFRRFVPVLIAAVTAASALAFASDPSSGSGCTRQIQVGVFDEQGHPIGGLSPSNFHLKVAGREVPVTFARQVPPARIVFVLDGSGSMHGAPWRAGLRSAEDVVTHAPEGTSFGIVAFGSWGDRQLELTTAKSDVIAFFQKLSNEQIDGPTRLFDAVERAISLLPSSQGRDSIFLVTDGGDNGSKATARKIRQSLEASGAHVVGLLLVDTSYRIPEAFSGFQWIAETSERTGGSMLQVHQPNLATEKDFYAEEQHMLPIWSAYLYGTYILEIANAREKPEKLAISAFVPQMKKIRLISPQVIPPCPTPVATAAAK
jgi:hypothetical protein